MAGLLGLGGSVFGGISAANQARSAASVPVGIGPAFARISGQESLNEAMAQAEMGFDQSKLAYQEGVADAIKTQRQFMQFRDSQAASMSHGGLTLSGSALAVTEETYQLGMQEYNAKMRRAEAQSRYLEMEGLSILRRGYFQKFAGEMQGQMSEFDHSIKQSMLKQQASQIESGAMWNAAAGGASILGGLMSRGGGLNSAGFRGGGNISQSATFRAGL